MVIFSDTTSNTKKEKIVGETVCAHSLLRGKEGRTCRARAKMENGGGSTADKSTAMEIQSCILSRTSKVIQLTNMCLFLTQIQ